MRQKKRDGAKKIAAILVIIFLFVGFPLIISGMPLFLEQMLGMRLPFLENLFGVKHATAEELGEMAKNGEIPYDIYRLAYYKSLQNPDLIFVIKDGVVLVGEKSKPRLDKFVPLKGRYIERINDSWFRVGIVGYDSLFTNKQYVVAVNVSLKPNGYVADKGFPSYLKFSSPVHGMWKNPSQSWDEGHPVDAIYIINPNPEDYRITKEIWSQIWKFGKENGLSDTQIYRLVYENFIGATLDYIEYVSWVKLPFTIPVLNEDAIEMVNISKPNSMIGAAILRGKGSCFVYTTLAQYILMHGGVNALDFAPWVVWKINTTHAYLFLPLNQINLSELPSKTTLVEFKIGNRDLPGVIYNTVVKKVQPTYYINANGKTLISISGYSFGFGLIPDHTAALYIFKLFPEKNK